MPLRKRPVKPSGIFQSEIKVGKSKHDTVKGSLGLALLPCLMLNGDLGKDLLERKWIRDSYIRYLTVGAIVDRDIESNREPCPQKSMSRFKDRHAFGELL